MFIDFKYKVVRLLIDYNHDFYASIDDLELVCKADLESIIRITGNGSLNESFIKTLVTNIENFYNQ